MNCCTTVTAGLVPGTLPLITFEQNWFRIRFVASNSVFAVLLPPGNHRSLRTWLDVTLIGV